MQFRDTSRLALAASDHARPQLRMLVVDDLPEICDLFRRTVRRMRDVQVQLVTEINSQRALGLVATQRFDLVVSDFRMREVSGIEVLRAARRAHPQGRRILITGYNEVPAAIGSIREAGVDAYLQKPIEDFDLGEVVRRALADDALFLEPLRRAAREMEDAAEREERLLVPRGE